MAEEFDQTPSERVDDKSDLKTILKNMPEPSSGASSGSKVVRPDVYRMLMGDRPVKFTEEQVGFVRNGGSDDGSCGGCVHFYQGKVAQKNVCEIFRPADDSSIEPADACRYFTTDQENFPRMNQKITAKESPEAKK